MFVQFAELPVFDQDRAKAFKVAKSAGRSEICGVE